MNKDDAISNAIDPDGTYVILGPGEGGITLPLEIFLNVRKDLKWIHTTYKTGQGTVLTGVVQVIDFKLISGSDLLAVEAQRAIMES